MITPARTILLFVVLIGAPLSLAQATSNGPAFKVDGKGNVLSLSNLTADLNCLPDRLEGRVVKRSFNDGGLVLQSFVLEYEEGARELINVHVDNLDSAGMATIGNVIQGLQRLIREGRTVDIGAQRCGAAGRVLYLDAVFSSHN